MQAVVTTPDDPNKLITREAPEPSASPGHAVVRVRATSINRGETRLIPSRPNGWAPGQDVAGVIEVPAPEGGPSAGTRVFGLAEGGAWSELVTVSLENLVLLPDNVDFVQAACLPVAGLTALRALRALGEVIGRERLVTGASGGPPALLDIVLRFGMHAKGEVLPSLVSGCVCTWAVPRARRKR